MTADGMTRATNSTPITESFLPPTEFYAYLDQFLTNSTLGATLFRSELVWVSEADVAQGLTASRMRAAYKATDAADEQAKSMRSTLTLTRTPNPNPNPIPNPNPNHNPYQVGLRGLAVGGVLESLLASPAPLPPLAAVDRAV